MLFHCVFKALFCLIFGVFLNRWEQWNRSKTLRRATKQRVLEIEQHRSRARFGMDLGVLWGVSLVTNVFCCRKNECKKTEWKKVPPKSETGGDGQVPGLLDSPPKVKDCLSNKQQLNKKLQQFNNSTKTPTIAESLLQFDCCCVCFLFDFFSSTVVVFVSCSISNSKWCCVCVLFDFKFKAHDLTRPELRLGEFSLGGSAPQTPEIVGLRPPWFTENHQWIRKAEGRLFRGFWGADQWK